MADTLHFFMTPEDEVAFLRALEPLAMEVYPGICEPRYRPFAAAAKNAGLLVEADYYLALPAAGEVVCRTVKRGPRVGMSEIDEIHSPVLAWSRSVIEEGELRSGRLWAELEVVGDRQRRMLRSDLLRRGFEEVRAFFKKRFQRSRPTGFFVGTVAARRYREGLVLREAGRKGGRVVPFR